MTNLLECYICNGKDDTGIIIKEQYICRQCEKQITDALPGEGNYEEYKEKIKKILFS